MCRVLRQFCRLVLLGANFGGAMGDHFLRGGWRWSKRERAEWLQRWAVRITRGLCFRVESTGSFPSAGLVVCNHLGYMDIPVLGSLAPMAFLSKSEVKDWPVIGYLTRIGGTLFIDRGRKREVASQGHAFRKTIEAGVPLALFLEGTSSDGSTVLPFRPSLLGPAIEGGWPVTPVYLEYKCLGPHEAATAVCWWGDMTFGKHLLELASVDGVVARVRFGKPRHARGERKALAQALHADVLRLREEMRGGSG